MSSSAANNKLFFKNVSSLCGFAGAEALPAQRDAWPSLALSTISLRVTSQQRLKAVGWQLVKLARHASLTRRLDVVRDVSEAIVGLPLPEEIKTVGRYYQAVVEKHNGNVEHARLVLAEVASGSTSAYKGRALLELGWTYVDADETMAALPFYLEATRASRAVDLLTGTQARIMIAVVRSIDDDHRGALGDLERVWPMVRLASHEHPALRYDYLNSLAVELAETGRIEEAKHAIEIALRSPFAAKYPNWKATRDEIANKERHTSYRPRLFSLAGPALVRGATAAQTSLSGPLQTQTDLDARVDLSFGIERPSAAAINSPTGIQSRTDNAMSGPPMGPAGLCAIPHRVLLTSSSCFIREEMTPGVISRQIANFQPALAPNSWKFLNTAPECAALRAAPAYSRISENSASCCDTGGDPPDDVRRADGYPKSPLARGPPAIPIKP
jgi:hypothetical protein